MVKSLEISNLVAAKKPKILIMKQPLDQLTKTICDALNGVAKVRKNFETFFIEAMILFISVKGRINFMQMSRYGDSCESRFRQNFQKDFDWVGYNAEFSKHTDGHRIAIALDPSYIDKSGKCTPGVGLYWSGCANASKWGMEITAVALVDIDTKEAIHLKAVQTVDTVKRGRPPKYLADMKEPNSLTAHYLRIIAGEKDSLLKICNLIVADAFFSKETFVKGLDVLGFNLISRFRSDARLRYLYDGPKTGKKGRPKKFGDYVNVKELDRNVFTEDIIADDEGKEAVLYSAIVWSVSLKRNVKVVIVDCLESNKKTQTRKIFFSTDTTMSAQDIMETYKTRFQIEFLLRDAKQFTGLTNCQSRKKESLEFHFNMSLTAINVARAFARDNNLDLSVSGVKTLIHNAVLIQRFLRKCGSRPNKLLNTNDFKDLLYYGVANAA